MLWPRRTGPRLSEAGRPRPLARLVRRRAIRGAYLLPVMSSRSENGPGRRRPEAPRREWKYQRSSPVGRTVHGEQSAQRNAAEDRRKEKLRGWRSQRTGVHRETTCSKGTELLPTFWDGAFEKCFLLTFETRSCRQAGRVSVGIGSGQTRAGFAMPVLRWRRAESYSPFHTLARARFGCFQREPRCGSLSTASIGNDRMQNGFRHFLVRP